MYSSLKKYCIHSFKSSPFYLNLTLFDSVSSEKVYSLEATSITKKRKQQTWYNGVCS